jgi:hypothetical protein
MATSKFTVEDALDVITHGDFYIVGYKNKAYIFSQEHFGDEDFDYGIYTVVPLSDVESGKGISLFDSVPDYFNSTLIDDIMECLYAYGVTKDTRQELKNKSISEWYKVLEPYSYQDVTYLEIARLYAGQLDFRPMTVIQAEKDEIELIEQYNEQ